MLEPPPSAEYPDLESLITSINQHAGTHGYAITRRRSKRRGGVLAKVFFICDQGRRYKPTVSEENRRRNTSTRSIECPFRAYALRRANSSQWEFAVDAGEHNHEPSAPEAYPMLRQLGQEAIHVIETSSASGSNVSEIFNNLLLKNPEFSNIKKDIYNAKAMIRTRNLGGYTPTQALMMNLGNDYYFEYCVDEDGHLTHLFFAYKGL